jgi:hypothetical protein
MTRVAAQPHVSLSGDINGDYIVEDERPDGRLILVRDTGIASIRRRLGTRAMTSEESAEFWREHRPHMQPPDGEG